MWLTYTNLIFEFIFDVNVTFGYFFKSINNSCWVLDKISNSKIIVCDYWNRRNSLCFRSDDPAWSQAVQIPLSILAGCWKKKSKEQGKNPTLWSKPANSVWKISYFLFLSSSSIIPKVKIKGVDFGPLSTPQKLFFPF